LAQEVTQRSGVHVSANTVRRILKDRGYSLQAPRKMLEGKRHPERDEQFEHIQDKADYFIKQDMPIISVDTKNKVLVGNFWIKGVEWQFKGGPLLTNIHDFSTDAEGKAAPYGVYDVAANSAFVSVGTSHDTGAFAVASIETWWTRMGCERYPNARELYITADAGGSNGYRLRLWKWELQRFADKYKLSVHVSHFPPGTSKWNKIEHRLFSFISLNWRGRPLTTYETIVNLISNTTTKSGLVVRARLDEKHYPLGTKVTDKDMQSLNIQRDEFHGEWNYTIRPRTKESK
jgi:hypothetical protein